MRSYPSKIVGVGHEGRAVYIAEHVEQGDGIELRREPDNAHDPQAVSCWHESRLIGYIPRSKAWISRCLDEGDRLEAVVTGFDIDDNDNLVAVAIDVLIMADGPGVAASAAPAPPPAIAPVPPSQPAPARPAGTSGVKRLLAALGLLAVCLVIAGSLQPDNTPNKKAAVCGNAPGRHAELLRYWTSAGIIERTDGDSIIVNGPNWLASDHRAKVTIAISYYCDPAGNNARANIYVHDHRNKSILASVHDGNYFD